MAVSCGDVLTTDPANGNCLVPLVGGSVGQVLQWQGSCARFSDIAYLTAITHNQQVTGTRLGTLNGNVLNIPPALAVRAFATSMPINLTNNSFQFLPNTFQSDLDTSSGIMFDPTPGNNNSVINIPRDGWYNIQISIIANAPAGSIVQIRGRIITGATFGLAVAAGLGLGISTTLSMIVPGHYFTAGQQFAAEIFPSVQPMQITGAFYSAQFVEGT